jgi:hypothetical protein
LLNCSPNLLILFITTASLHHLEVLEQAMASPFRVLWLKNRLSPRFPKSKNSTRCWLPGAAPACWRSITGWRVIETVKRSLVGTFLTSSESKVFAGAERV